MDLSQFIEKWIGKKCDFDGYAGAQCFTKGHQVLMSNWTYKPIEDVKIGEKVIGYDNKPNTVTKTFNSKKKVIHLKTELGDFYVTPEHPFYCKSGKFIAAKNLEKENPALFDKEIYEDTGLTDNELRFLGFWLGDGNIGAHKDNRTDEIRITYGLKKRDFVHSLGLIGEERPHHESENAYVAGLLKRGHEKLVDIILKKCGTEKKLPLIFSNRESALIVEGLINADGSSHHNSFVISNTNLSLLMSIQAMCINLGYATKSIRLSKRNSDYIRIKGKLVKSVKPLYKLTICLNNEKTHKRYVEYLETFEEEVFNLETDGTHTYICNNYKVHNCVDLPRMYWKEVGGVPVKMEPCSTTGGAKDLFNDYDKMPLEKKYLKKVKTPAQGDVAVWNSIAGNSTYGHVAIVLAAFKNWLLVLEQDGFRQDGTKFAYRSKGDILGYLRRR